MKSAERMLVDFLLVFCGALLTYDFSLILIRGIIFPVANLYFYFASVIIIFCIFFIGIRSLVKTARLRTTRELIVCASLLSIANGILMGYVILPVPFILSGDVSLYSAGEQNLAILLSELAISAIFFLIGLANAVLDIRKLRGS